MEHYRKINKGKKVLEENRNNTDRKGWNITERLMQEHTISKIKRGMVVMKKSDIFFSRKSIKIKLLFTNIFPKPKHMLLMLQRISLMDGFIGDSNICVNLRKKRHT